ncbi:hypothetical protein ACIU0H_09575 [Pseudomonas aeruginosa]
MRWVIGHSSWDVLQGVLRDEVRSGSNGIRSVILVILIYPLNDQNSQALSTK